MARHVRPNNRSSRAHTLSRYSIIGFRSFQPLSDSSHKHAMLPSFVPRTSERFESPDDFPSNFLAPPRTVSPRNYFPILLLTTRLAYVVEKRFRNDAIRVERNFRSDSSEISGERANPGTSLGNVTNCGHPAEPRTCRLVCHRPQLSAREHNRRNRLSINHRPNQLRHTFDRDESAEKSASSRGCHDSERR